jgi:hypothetical protein
VPSGTHSVRRSVCYARSEINFSSVSSSSCDDAESTLVHNAIIAIDGERCCGSARGVSRPLEPLGWPNQGFLLAYMAMAPLRCLFILQWSCRFAIEDLRATTALLVSNAPAWLHEAPASWPVVRRPGSLAAAKRRPSCLVWRGSGNGRSELRSNSRARPWEPGTSSCLLDYGRFRSLTTTAALAW